MADKVEICCPCCGNKEGRVRVEDTNIKFPLGRQGMLQGVREITIGFSAPKIHCTQCGAGFWDEDYVAKKRADVVKKLTGLTRK